jgi:glycosyltransferase involved in cell wall biosynthesis
MAEALARLPGITVEVAATDADGPAGRLRPEDLPPSPVPVRLFARTASEQWKISLPLRKWLNARAGDYDLLHVHALWSFATAAACSAARKHKKPVVIRPCGMLSAYTWGRGAWKKRLYWGLVERRNVAGARAVHATSPGEAEDVARLGVVPADRVFDIPLGLEPHAWEAPKAPAPLGFDGRPVVLYLSRLHPKKGVVDILLPAFARLKSDAVLVIAGAADERTPGYDAEIREAVSRLGLSDRVRLLGPVAAADRWGVYDAADVFVLPSHSENFGVVVTEAMACGVPVVGTDAVQSCEHVTAAGAG